MGYVVAAILKERTAYETYVFLSTLKNPNSLSLTNIIGVKTSVALIWIGFQCFWNYA